MTEPVTFDLGGLEATSVEVAVDPSWTAMCPFNTDPFVVLVTDSEEPPTRNHGLWLGGRAHMGFVDVGDEAVVIWVDGADGQPFDDMMALTQPVIESIRFEDLSRPNDHRRSRSRKPRDGARTHGLHHAGSPTVPARSWA